MTTITSASVKHVAEPVITTGSTVLAGVAAIALSIIGLAHAEPHYMVTISAIVLGTSLLFEGAYIAREYRKLLAASMAATATPGTETMPSAIAAHEVELGGGLSAQSVAGIAAVVLAVLALIGVAPDPLVAISAIVLGTGWIMASASLARVNGLRIGTIVPAPRLVARGALTGAVRAQVAVGVAAVILGILALIGISEITLPLIAMLALGASSLISGSAFAARMLTASA